MFRLPRTDDRHRARCIWHQIDSLVTGSGASQSQKHSTLNPDLPYVDTKSCILQLSPIENTLQFSAGLFLLVVRAQLEPSGGGVTRLAEPTPPSFRRRSAGCPNANVQMPPSNPIACCLGTWDIEECVISRFFFLWKIGTENVLGTSRIEVLCGLHARTNSCSLWSNFQRTLCKGE